jgi:hypothetical protein
MLFFLAALLAASASAEISGKPAGSGRAADVGSVSITGCSKAQEANLRQALGAAAGIARDCLGTPAKPGLAPDIGGAILALIDKNDLALYCDDAPDAEGDAVANFVSGKPVIGASTMKGGKRVDMDPAVWGRWLLHELIHATDEKGALYSTKKLHNSGWPDRVYGCHLACTGEGDSAGMKAKVALLEHSKKTKIAPLESPFVHCPAAGGCGFAKKMAALCSPSVGDAWVAVEKAFDDRFEQTSCLMRALVSEEPAPCKASVCADIRSSVAQEQKERGIPRAEFAAALMIHVYDVLMASRAMDAGTLSPRDKELFDALNQAGVLMECRGMRLPGRK